MNYTTADLSNVDLTLCDRAHFLTKEPDHVKVGQAIEKRKELGLADRAILDANLVTSYLNFVNRMVLGLDVEMENDQCEGYKY